MCQKEMVGNISAVLAFVILVVKSCRGGESELSPVLGGWRFLPTFFQSSNTKGTSSGQNP